MKHTKNCMAKCVHSNTAVITKALLYLPGMDSTNMKWVRPAVYSILSMYN